MNWLTRFLWLIVWSLLAIYAAFTVWLGVAGLAYPYQLDYGEGIVLWFAQEIARGHAIYKSLSEFPFASSNYPPVAMTLSAALTPIFGDGYVAGRLLNFASALIVAALIFRIVRGETRDRRAAALAALFFIGSPYIYHWIPLFRVDLIGLAFAFTGIFFVWKWQSNRRVFYFLLFTFAFLLALFTKHTLVAASAAAFIAIFLRDRRAAIGFAGALGIVGGAIYFALDLATRGGFAAGLIESNATVFLTEQLIALVQNFALTFPILILLAAWAWIDRIRARQFGVLEWYALISFAMLVLSGRLGAWENYFFEALTVTCVFAGFTFHVSGFRAQVANLKPATWNLGLCVLLLIQLGLTWHDPRIAADLIARDTPANQQLDTLLKQTPGTIISEDMGALATSGKPVAYYTFQYSMLARSGKWNQMWELNGLRDQQFPLVILEHGTREDVDHYRRFTREFVSALDRYYAHTQTIGKYEIFAPASALNLQSVDFGDAISLIGWSAQPETLKPGNLKFSIVWQAKRAMERRYIVFAHLVRGEDKIAQDDHAPLAGVYPTTRWAANEMVRDEFTLNVPGDLSPGKYVLRVGWYDTEAGDRLHVSDSADDSFALTTFEIK